MIIVGKVTTLNTSDGVSNYGVVDKEGTLFNLKITKENNIKMNYVYEFTCDVIQKERTSYVITQYVPVDDFEFDKKNEVLRFFYPTPAITYPESKDEIDKYIGLLDNDIIKAITIGLIEDYKDKFYVYPAASRMHHAYVGGLAYHSIGMLHMADGFIENYPYLDKNYVYAGIILHDIGKAIELSGPVNTEYSLKGQLIGHLVLGAMEIERKARELGYQETKEAMILEHMLISHHGQPQFGSAKKPMTAEALVLWYIDTIDSKFRVLGEEFERTEHDSYTENIGVLDRTKIYKV